jgi:hypothetical protein
LKGRRFPRTLSQGALVSGAGLWESEDIFAEGESIPDRTAKTALLEIVVKSQSLIDIGHMLFGQMAKLFDEPDFSAISVPVLDLDIGYNHSISTRC